MERENWVEWVREGNRDGDQVWRNRGAGVRGLGERREIWRGISEKNQIGVTLAETPSSRGVWSLRWLPSVIRQDFQWREVNTNQLTKPSSQNLLCLQMFRDKDGAE